MFYFVMTLHLVISLVLCVVVLLQSSKGDGLAGAFGGGGGGQAVFGARGVTTVLHKATIYLAIAFMTTSVSLVFLTMQRTGGNRSTLSQQAADRVPVSSTNSGAFDTGGADVVPAGDDASRDDSASSDQIVPPAPAESTGGEGDQGDEQGNSGGEQ